MKKIILVLFVVLAVGANFAWAGPTKTDIDLLIKNAEQGHTSSQYYLGWAYFYGDNVKKDNKMAYMWALLAAGVLKDGQKGYTCSRLLRGLEAEMTPEEIAEAQAMADEWLKEYQTKQNK